MTPTHAVKKGGHALPLLCLPPVDHQRSNREVGRAAHPSRRDRADRDEPSAQMASRFRQHLQDDTASGSLSAAPPRRASRRGREELARVARNSPACLPYRGDHYNARGRPDGGESLLSRVRYDSPFDRNPTDPRSAYKADHEPGSMVERRQKPRAPPPRNRWFADSPLEGDGFEPSVPHDMTEVSTVLFPVGRP